jgi:hypothetical protein
VCLTFIARLCAFYLAGMFAAERAGTVASAGAAGMLAAALDGASSVALTLLRIAVWPGLVTSSQAVPPSGDALLTSVALFACIGLAGGGVLGTLGWLDGRKRYDKPRRRQKDPTAEYIRLAAAREPR